MKVLTDKNNRMFFSQYKLTQNEEFEITRGQSWQLMEQDII